MRPDRAPFIQHAAERFLAEVLKRETWISANNRIGTRDAARLVGITPGHMRNLISQGRGPVQSGPGGGHKKTVSLLDLAEWEDLKRHG